MSNLEDDTVDSWETLENHPELDKKLQKMANDVEKELKKEEENDLKTKQKIMTLNWNASPFIPASSIRILKREENNVEKKADLEQTINTPKQPAKSLKEREEAYREARLRILGSANDEYEEALIG